MTTRFTIECDKQPTYTEQQEVSSAPWERDKIILHQPVPLLTELNKESRTRLKHLAPTGLVFGLAFPTFDMVRSSLFQRGFGRSVGAQC